jgi:hypothetical protein
MKFKTGDQLTYARGNNIHTIIGRTKHNYIIESVNTKKNRTSTTEMMIMTFDDMTDTDSDWIIIKKQPYHFDEDLFKIDT